MASLLQVRGLRVGFRGIGGQTIQALRGVDLSVESGQMVGVLGESGCGKSTMARTLLRLLPRTAHIAGTAAFEGSDLLSLTEAGLARIRGARLCLIPQDSGQALNPVLCIGDQVAEVLRAHRKWNWTRCRQEAEVLLHRTLPPIGERSWYDAYPHQLSGGQKQRVVIAQALACEPALIIADEPTASLDAQLESEIVQLLNELHLERRMSLLFITHKPSMLMGVADRVAVMYAGRIVEEGPANLVFGSPRHPYTRALLNCMRSSASLPVPAGMRLPTVPGSAPDPGSQSPGCSFAPRCSERLAACESKCPPAIELERVRRVECLLYDT